MKKYLFLCILIAVFSCNKEDDYDLHKYPGLPDATREGKHTLGCLINGKPWVASKDGDWIIGFPSPKVVGVYYGEYRKNIADFDTFYLENHFKLRKEENCPTGSGYCIKEDFNIYLQPVKKIGVLNNQSLSKFLFRYYIDNINQERKLYIIDSLVSPYIQITKLDTVHNIVSGLFDFRLKEIDEPKDTLHISQGRFDAEYWPK